MKQSLKEVLSSYSLSDDQKLDIFHKICLELKKLHDRRIIHADLNPENILVKFDGAKAQVSLRSSVHSKLIKGACVLAIATGTKPYTAPELYGNQLLKRYFFATDIYALGVILSLDLRITALEELSILMCTDLSSLRPDLDYVIKTCDFTFYQLQSEDYESYSDNSCDMSSVSDEYTCSDISDDEGAETWLTAFVHSRSLSRNGYSDEHGESRPEIFKRSRAFTQ